LLVPAIERLLTTESLEQCSSLFNPLVLCGATGSGKSLLSKAVVRCWTARLGSGQTAYYTAADFARQLRLAREEGCLAEFRAQLASLKLFVIEDVDRLSTRLFVQRELRDTLDMLLDQNAVVLATAQEVPAAWNKLDLGLRDRLDEGLVVRLRMPGIEARLELLELAARDAELELSEQEFLRLAAGVEGSPVEVLRSLREWELNERHEVDLAADRQKVGIKPIVAVVSRYCGVTQAALRSSARRKSLVYARGVVVYLARKLTNLSYAQIGVALGGRDHSTMMHAHHTIEAFAQSNPDTQTTLEELQRILRAP
jgi:chromosomal replication initiator protein